MKELVRTNDPVELSWVQAILAEINIECLLLDEHASAIEGSIGAIQRRLMVLEEDEGRARAALEQARRDIGNSFDAN